MYYVYSMEKDCSVVKGYYLFDKYFYKFLNFNYRLYIL